MFTCSGEHVLTSGDAGVTCLSNDVTILRHQLSPAQSVRLGAPAGQADRAPLVPKLRAATTDEPVVVHLDFDGITAVNGSYLRATFLWLIRAGATAAAIEEGRLPAAPEGLEALHVFPVATNMEAAVREELSIALGDAQMSALVADASEGDRIVKAVRVGHLDPALESTLSALAKAKRASATELCEAFPEKPAIKPPAWSNRLSELYRQRLARREREGRQWFYVSLAEEVSRGR